MLVQHRDNSTLVMGMDQEEGLNHYYILNLALACRNNNRDIFNWFLCFMMKPVLRSSILASSSESVSHHLAHLLLGNSSLPEVWSDGVKSDNDGS